MHKAILLILLGLLGVPANAQTHSATLNWAASTTSGIQGYNIYRAICSGVITANVCSVEGTFSKVGTTTSSALTFTDSTVSAAAKYSWYVTSFCPSAGCTNGEQGESAASNHFANTIPSNPPNPPILNGVTVAVLEIDDGQRFAMHWQDRPGATTTFTLVDAHGRTITAGKRTSASGVFYVSYITEQERPAPFLLTVCDTAEGLCQIAIAN